MFFRKSVVTRYNIANAIMKTILFRIAGSGGIVRIIRVYSQNYKETMITDVDRHTD